MSQVGCASASPHLYALQLVGGPAPERATRGGDHDPLDRARRLRGQQLVQRGVLGVDRDHRAPGGLRELHHELAADDQALLVGERHVDALAQRGHRGREAGRSDQPVQHEVGAGLDDRAAPAPRGRSAPRPSPRCRRACSAARSSWRLTRVTSNSAACASRRSQFRRRRQADDLEVVAARDDVQRLHADRPRGAEDHELLHGWSSVGGGESDDPGTRPLEAH